MTFEYLNYFYKKLNFLLLSSISIYEKLYTKGKKQFLLYQNMSTYKDIKELSTLSRLEIEESEIQKTSVKIKEIISFFNKLDEFESNGEQELPYNYMKTEKKIDDLRDDITTLNSKDANGGGVERAAPFSFLNRKNGYVIGPRI